jgi:putative phosphoribosyl transferase
MAGPQALARLAAPTLLIVGELDGTVIGLNAEAHDAMRSLREIVIVPRAGHLFEEPGTPDQLVELASNWFLRHVGDSR